MLMDIVPLWPFFIFFQKVFVKFNEVLGDYG